MYKKIDFSKLEGLAVFQGTLDFLQICYENTFSAIAKVLGDKVIISGAELINGSYTEGWICLNGELLPFTGGLQQPKIVVEQLADTELFGDDSIQTVYFTRRAKLASASNVDGIAIEDFKRLSNLQIITRDVANLKNDLGNLEDAFSKYKPDWNNIQNKPDTFAPSAHKHKWADITDPPEIGVQIVYKASVRVGDPGSSSQTNPKFQDAASPDSRLYVYHNLGYSNYMVIGSLRSISSNWNDDDDVFHMIGKCNNDYFELLLREVNNLSQNLQFDYVIIKM
ncbi:hypothetical protein [Pinibacter soli]|uniref:Uncharacterized protein n=1 Tax=Pinibacter soli TaxID=3044211 RepID=A0ABT6R997_9BACT|nr:hypothetical protein [Pinibacter soli]MDI3319117.1 hypothetical protein [Pinibacter soli]